MSEVQDTETPRPVWGAWATLGFGAVVMAVSFFVQTVVSVAILLIRIFTGNNVFSGLYQPDDAMSLVLVALDENLGLVTSVSGCISAVVCGGLVVLIILARRGPGS